MHLHSEYSDGVVNINSIINSIKNLKLSGFSLTDHDLITGIQEIQGKIKNDNIDFIPGIEFGITFKQKEIHILGYFIDTSNERILSLIRAAFKNRTDRTDIIIDNLKELNIDISRSQIEKKIGKNYISRNHIADYLVENRYCKNLKEAYKKYLGINGIAYSGKHFSTPKEIIETIKESGGVAILAHPSTIEDVSIVKKIIEFGVDGLEVINSKHSIDDINIYYNLANEHHLLKTCGSDCHGRIKHGYKYIGRFLQNKKNIDKLKRLHELRISKI